MVSFAEILRLAADELYHARLSKPLSEMSKSALRLDQSSVEWRQNLPSSLNLDKSSLSEPEWISKQKVVLKLRFWYTRIILHRQFLIAASTQRDLSSSSTHIDLCVRASRQTISLLYDTYFHRPYFRTWYNATYTLYASMIILYLLFWDFDRVTRTELIEEVEKSLEILNSMDTIYVARSCSHLIHEMLQIAKKPPRSYASQHRLTNLPAIHNASSARANPGPGDKLTANDLGESPRNIMLHPSATTQSELLNSLIDFDFLGDFAGLGDLNMYLNGSGGELPFDVPHDLQEQQNSRLGNAPMFADSVDFVRGTENGVWMGVSPEVESDIHDPFGALHPDSWI
ncbi:uncharacterized protein Z518_06443 [Rhinocladiella mackenziei CBS 650.93]|uniref:Transcription factor domain-containing protein n=1 Tax=Rhinocladiella mackenziei CBS 650.93 TaxID=1442369 RepID=A0A0D2IQY9_9EURO|nr:uncharacterized protein Z518_06443 [Rhinocladiella mackenziei CBS 650.93]KIX05571.1 hypothetical protein Z518_06443 [Rhinocladiella mackenziei CBS 650.93]